MYFFLICKNGFYFKCNSILFFDIWDLLLDATKISNFLYLSATFLAMNTEKNKIKKADCSSCYFYILSEIFVLIFCVIFVIFKEIWSCYVFCCLNGMKRQKTDLGVVQHEKILVFSFGLPLFWMSLRSLGEALLTIEIKSWCAICTKSLRMYILKNRIGIDLGFLKMKRAELYSCNHFLRSD